MMLSSKKSVTLKQQVYTLPLVTQRPTARRSLRGSAAASAVELSLPEPLVYAKAMLTVASRRAAELALDCASEISISIAEQPRRMKEFQDEVQAVAERELQGSSSRQPGLLASSSSGGSSSSSSASSSNTAGGKDLEAIVDELRADIAASRALLQQIKTGDMGPLGPTSSSK